MSVEPVGVNFDVDINCIGKYVKDHVSQWQAIDKHQRTLINACVPGHVKIHFSMLFRQSATHNARIPALELPPRSTLFMIIPSLPKIVAATVSYYL